MKKKFTPLMLVLLPLLSLGQLSLQVQNPGSGLMQKSQLWNAIAVNNSNTKYDCRLELVLLDRVSGQQVMSASTGVFTLNAGARQLNQNVLAPVQYNYIQASNNSSLRNFLPAGSYTACYSLTAGTLKGTNLAEECIEFDVEPLSPLRLMMPQDSTVFDVDPNNFSWIPPSPDGMFDGLTYDITMVKVNEGQSGVEAIGENIPAHQVMNNIGTTLSSVATKDVFEKDVWYAWQVTGRDQRNYISKSEVWLFKARKQPQIASDYVLLKTVGEAPDFYYIKDKVLNIKFYSYEKSFKGNIQFKNSESKVIHSVEHTIAYGDNLLHFKLNSSFTNGKAYTIELKDVRNQIHSASFTIN